MGKGQRIRAARAAEKEAQKIESVKKAKKKKAAVITSSAIAIVLVVCIAAGLIYNAIYSASYSRGDIQRKAIVMQTDHYTVDAAMMSYFFYSQYNTFVNNYSSYLSYINLDTEKSLKKQDSSFMEGGGTWYDYFKSEAGKQVKELLYLAEKANEEGLELDDNDQQTIQKTLDNYKTYAANAGYEDEKFISMVFGTGVKESDARKCLELTALADKYYQEYRDSLHYTDEELESYYNENINTYRYVDYYSYAVAASDTGNSDTYPEAEAKAKELAAVTSTDAFRSWVESYMRSSAEITDEYTEEDLNTDVQDKLNGLESKKSTYSESDEASEWLFTEAKVGETYIKNDESGTYTVYFCTAAPYRDEALTRTIRDLVFTTATYETKEAALEKAKEVMVKMTEEGLTEETFQSYAAQYSENTATSANGGLCENYKESTFEGNIAKWAFSDARKEGDFEIVEFDDGQAICYYIGVGIPAWKSDCLSAKKSSDYEAAYEEWTQNITLSENEKNYSKIPDNV